MEREVEILRCAEVHTHRGLGYARIQNQGLSEEPEVRERKIRAIRGAHAQGPGEKPVVTETYIVVDHDLLDDWIDTAERERSQLSRRVEELHDRLWRVPTSGEIRRELGVLRRIAAVFKPSVIERAYRSAAKKNGHFDLTITRRSMSTRPDKLE